MSFDPKKPVDTGRAPPQYLRKRSYAAVADVRRGPQSKLLGRKSRRSLMATKKKAKKKKH
jgi:predicted DCC family thiol-disulfide oxidoreductase YuxK